MSQSIADSVPELAAHASALGSSAHSVSASVSASVPPIAALRPAAAGAGAVEFPAPAAAAASVGKFVPKTKTMDAMYDEIVNVEYDVFEKVLDELVEVGDLEKRWNDEEDRSEFTAKYGLGWSDIVKYMCPIKKQIILTLIDNPRTFFVLYNTQKGKSRIVAAEIKNWALVPDKKVVAFLIVDNDKTLADQTNEGLTDNIDSVAKRFLLSSGAKEKHKVDELRTYIDAYAADRDGEYKMPVIVALNNDDQIKKVLKLMDHIRNKVEVRKSSLRYGVVFDEADKVYPVRRSKEFSVDGSTLSFKKLLVENDNAVHRLGFVSATDGDLLENEEYEECANAYCYPVPAGDANYRALHHDTDAIIKHIPHNRQDSNDAYAEKVIQSNKDYFSQKVELKDGTQGYRKIIVNGGSKTTAMASFASRRVSEGSYAITINMHGITVYRPGKSNERRSTKGVKFGELLFQLYRELGLHDKPLYIIGRRKVDRGLGFHYAPRDGSEGLIWTDMILGRIDDKNVAVQKAGRLAGIVAQCPQYPGKLTWWTDERTGNSVLRHNVIIDAVGEKHGHSALQAVKRAEVEEKEKKAEEKEDPNDPLLSEAFVSVKEAKKWGKENLEVVPSATSRRTEDDKISEEGRFYKLAYIRPILPLEELRKAEYLSIGLGSKFTEENKKEKTKPESSPRVIPVFIGDAVYHVVAFKRFSAKDFKFE